MRVGFIGIGVMGWAMAANILKGGHELTVFDLDPEATKRFAAEVGGKAASSVAEIAGAEVVVTMLPTSKHVRRALTEDEDGAFLKAAQPGLIVIDMSSSEPGDTVKLGPILAERGAILIDAPVSGARPRAISGTLALMIGGEDEAAIEKATPILQCMGDRLFRTGPLGSGHAMKALNNYVAATGLAAACEAVLIGQRFGLDGDTMADILNVSTGKNFATENLLKQHVLSGSFSAGFTLGLMTKDVTIAADLGEQVNLDAPISRLVRERFIQARDKVGAGKDNSACILAWDEDLG
ncbi:MAG TPA: NAD(P)-dependent oxidoreductase [Caulobacteraceae bacterium]|nr:NAD(P)-dependent oxidoreductase [Caulobacteraceae bacterium]